MNKLILSSILLLLLPIALWAQDNPPLFEDFAKGIKDVNVFAFNDHLNVMQLTTDNDKFDLVAVNDKMQILWKTSLAGYGVKVDKFKNKVMALVSTDHSFAKGSNNIYRAYIIEPETGKVLSDKIVYESTNDFAEYLKVSTGNGDFFKIAVRQSDMKRKVTGSLWGLVPLGPTVKVSNGTRVIKVIDYNEKLDSIKSFNAVVSNGIFTSLYWNTHGDMFVTWFNGPSIEVYKYETGATTPSGQLTIPISFKLSKSYDPGAGIHILPSKNPNVVYYSLIYLNPDKDPELSVGKLDFAKNTTGYVTQVLNKNNLKAIKKSFVPPNKDFDDVDLGSPYGMNINSMREFDDKIMVNTTSDYSVSDRGLVVMYESNLLINCYDHDLKLNFQQILPTSFKCKYASPSIGYHLDGNKLQIVTNTKSIQGVYGVLDMRTGKWDKIEHLSKKHISNSDFIEGYAVLWFGGNFVVPYFDATGIYKLKYNLTLQQNQY